MGLFSLGGLIMWPSYTYTGTWLCFILILDPVNHVTGRPSIVARLMTGDWRLVVALGLGALVCGWFWEMWNFWAFPKWEYNISFVDFAHVSEMPLLGYGGYLPFGLETYAAYHFVSGFFRQCSDDYLRIEGREPRERPTSGTVAAVRSQPEPPTGHISQFSHSSIATGHHLHPFCGRPV